MCASANALCCVRSSPKRIPNSALLFRESIKTNERTTMRITFAQRGFIFVYIFQEKWRARSLTPARLTMLRPTLHPNAPPVSAPIFSTISQYRNFSPLFKQDEAAAAPSPHEAVVPPPEERSLSRFCPSQRVGTRPSSHRPNPFRAN